MGEVKTMAVLPVLVILGMIHKTTNIRVWDTVFMDRPEQCQSYVRNDDMEEGDIYLVNSDSSQNGGESSRRPAECSTSFNLGDRYVSVRLLQWWCNKPFREPFLDVYDDCHGERTNLLVRYNCSVHAPAMVYTSGSCVQLYHYRGHVRSGQYYFTVEVTATHDVIAFPAGGIAAIVIGSIVMILIIIKVVCMLSGWEEKMPEGRRTGVEDRKFILAGEEPSTEHPLNPDGDVEEIDMETSLDRPRTLYLQEHSLAPLAPRDSEATNSDSDDPTTMTSDYQHFDLDGTPRRSRHGGYRENCTFKL